MEPNIDTGALSDTSDRADWPANLEAAAREVFDLMLGAKMEIVEESEVLGRTDMTGMVGLAGQLCGVLSVRCTKVTAAKVATRMLGHEIETTDDQNIRDALGEMCNMVAGNFKAKIPGLSDSCLLSVPTIVMGSDYHLHSLASGDRLAVCMMFESEPLSFILDVHH